MSASSCQLGGPTYNFSMCQALVWRHAPPLAPGARRDSTAGVAAIGVLSNLFLVATLVVTVAAYLTIFLTTERSPREILWTLLPAVLLAVLVAISIERAGLVQLTGSSP